MNNRIILTVILLLSYSLHAQIDSTKSNKNNFKYNLPKQISWVSDYENIFNDSQLIVLDSLLESFSDSSTYQIAILTVDSSMVMLYDFEKYSLQVARNWRIGKKNINKGILIVISSYLKKIRIQVSDPAIIDLPNNETKKIIDNFFIPYFKTNDYFKGTLFGLQEILKKLKK